MGKSVRERLQQQREDLKKSGGGDFNYFIFKEGTARHRIPLCGPKGEEADFAKEIVYFYLGQDIKGVVSPATFGEKCAIQEAYDELHKSDDEADKELAQKFAPRRRFLAPMIKYDGKEVDDIGMKLGLLTSGQYQTLIDLWLDEEDWGDFTQPDTGYDLKFGRTGSGKLDTVYTVTACPKSKTPKAYAKEVVDVEEMVREIIPSYEETQDLIKQYLKMDLDEDKPKKEKKKGKKNKGI